MLCADLLAGGHPTSPTVSLLLFAASAHSFNPLGADMDSGNTTTTYAPDEVSPIADMQKLDLGALLLGCVIQAMYVVA